MNVTRAMALDYGSQGVRVNAVCPSLVATPMVTRLDDETLKLLIAEFRYKERVNLPKL
ncbi:SDR family oxidoreductase [Xenorhabdus littoralis]|uniref:SDR family oxidoreductase n=1 Tax=Xenorhabdus littoralis TaxID=2582835 RepID=UPI0029E80B94|nr:SDR family oxidoreductase [Xenorhabdus sp. psl]